MGVITPVAPHVTKTVSIFIDPDKGLGIPQLLWRHSARGFIFVISGHRITFGGPS
jgi:hypothetical protein